MKIVKLKNKEPQIGDLVCMAKYDPKCHDFLPVAIVLKKLYPNKPESKRSFLVHWIIHRNPDSNNKGSYWRTPERNELCLFRLEY